MNWKIRLFRDDMKKKFFDHANVINYMGYDCGDYYIIHNHKAQVIPKSRRAFHVFEDEDYHEITLEEWLAYDPNALQPNDVVICWNNEDVSGELFLNVFKNLDDVNTYQHIEKIDINILPPKVKAIIEGQLR